MLLYDTYSHHYGANVWKDKNLYEWLKGIFDLQKITIGKDRTTVVRDALKNELEMVGWAFNVRVDSESDINVFAKKNDLIFQLQTGNVSRYAYDLLKIQHLYTKKEISAAALAVPTKKAAQLIGSNITNIDRVQNELQVFSRIITVPMIVLAFE